jgi:hypothetical protein
MMTGNVPTGVPQLDDRRGDVAHGQELVVHSSAVAGVVSGGEQDRRVADGVAARDLDRELVRAVVGGQRASACRSSSHSSAAASTVIESLHVSTRSSSSADHDRLSKVDSLPAASMAWCVTTVSPGGNTVAGRH